MLATTSRWGASEGTELGDSQLIRRRVDPLGAHPKEVPSRSDRVVYSNVGEFVWLTYYLLTPGEGSSRNWIDVATGFPSLIS